MADSITDPESNPYFPPESDFVRVPDQVEFSTDYGAKKPSYASFGQRFLAFLLDGVIIYGFL